MAEKFRHAGTEWFRSILKKVEHDMLSLHLLLMGKDKASFIKPFNYTLKKLVSYKMWKQAVTAEIKRRCKTKGKSSGWYAFKDSDNPYLARYGDGWQAKMEVEPGSELKKI